jgi:hypothetical protein
MSYFQFVYDMCFDYCQRVCIWFVACINVLNFQQSTKFIKNYLTLDLAICSNKLYTVLGTGFFNRKCDIFVNRNYG